jgi:hypothetical protein
MSSIRVALISIGITLAASACAAQGELPRQAPEREAPSPPPRAASGPNTSVPLVLDIAAARDVAPGEVELELVIDRRTSDPVALELQLPPGVELIEGEARAMLDEPGRRIVRKVRLRMPNGTPLDDVRVVADARGLGYGVRATAAYRFGRPAPKLAQPERRPSASVANGKRLGRPIPLD